MVYRCLGENPEELKKIIAGIKKFTDELVAKGPKACHQYLIELGTHNPDGTLTKEYGGKYTQKK